VNQLITFTASRTPALITAGGRARQLPLSRILHSAGQEPQHASGLRAGRGRFPGLAGGPRGRIDR